MRFILFITISVIISSCAFHSGMMTANLPSDFNQEIVRKAEGQATAVYVLGIGGLDHKHLVTDAKKNLYSNHPLKDGEAYANLVVDQRLFPFLVVNVNQIFVTADIVVDPKVDNDSLQYYFEPPLNEKGIRMLSGDGIWIKANDEVTVTNGSLSEKGRVVKIMGRKKVLVYSPTLGERKYGLKKVFLHGENIRFRDVDFAVGETAPIEFQGMTRNASVIGINRDYLLLKTSAPETGVKYKHQSFRDTEKLIEKENEKK